jgi:ATP-dependent DNA helicase RecQ
VRRFVEAVEALPDELVTADQLDAVLEPRDPANPWQQLVRDEIAAWRAEVDEAQAARASFLVALRDALADAGRATHLGSGLTLATLHGAKGLEWPHVLVLDQEPDRREGDPDAERRLLYVGCTRARETLTVFELARGGSPHVAELDDPDLLHRDVRGRPDGDLVSYELIALEDLWIDSAGRRPPGDARHRALAEAQVGDEVRLVRTNGFVEVHDRQGRELTSLSAAGRQRWADRLGEIERARIVGLVEWEAAMVDEAYRGRLRVERWEVPVVEVLVRR